jgi:hypothetical protein
MKKSIFIILSYGLVIMMANTSCQETSAQTTEEPCYTIIVGETTVDSSPSKQLKVDCPAGMKALGAGWSVLDETSAILEGQATYFEPSYDGTHWLTNAKNESDFASTWKLRVRLICGCKEIFK